MIIPSPETLALTVCSVLDEAAFVLVQPCEASDPGGEPLIVARISLHGSAPASLTLAVTPVLGAEIATNLLGIDPDDPQGPERAVDAVSEMLNMIAGALSAQCLGSGLVWKLGTARASFVENANTVLIPHAVCKASLTTEQGERVWAALSVQHVSEAPEAFP